MVSYYNDYLLHNFIMLYMAIFSIIESPKLEKECGVWFLTNTETMKGKDDSCIIIYFKELQFSFSNHLPFPVSLDISLLCMFE
jgi:hypothetical protein